MEKIDSHVHVGDAGKWDLKLSLQDLEEIRDQNEVTHAVVIPWLHGPQYGPEQNLDLLEQVAGNPAYLFFYWVHPDPEFSNMDQTLRVIEDSLGSISGIKFHPSISQHTIDSPGLRPMIDLAAKHQLPILVHTGRNDISDARHVHSAALRFPAANFIMAHLGGQAYDRIMDMMDYFTEVGVPPNVYWDTSQSAHSVLLRRAVDRLGVGRLLFGTDVPFKEYWTAIHMVESIGLSGSQKEAIYRGNMMRLLRIDAARP